MDNLALVGLTTTPIDLNLRDPSSYTVKNIGGEGVDRKVEGGQVTYSYFLKEYQGLEEYPSTDKVLHCSSRCTGRTIKKSDVYDNTGSWVGNIGWRPTLSASPHFETDLKHGAQISLTRPAPSFCTSSVASTTSIQETRILRGGSGMPGIIFRTPWARPVLQHVTIFFFRHLPCLVCAFTTNKTTKLRSS
jgi:hypothetical protein